MYRFQHIPSSPNRSKICPKTIENIFFYNAKLEAKRVIRRATDHRNKIDRRDDENIFSVQFDSIFFSPNIFGPFRKTSSPPASPRRVSHVESNVEGSRIIRDEITTTKQERGKDKEKFERIESEKNRNGSNGRRGEDKRRREAGSSSRRGEANETGSNRAPRET